MKLEQNTLTHTHTPTPAHTYSDQLYKHKSARDEQQRPLFLATANKTHCTPCSSCLPLFLSLSPFSSAFSLWPALFFYSLCCPASSIFWLANVRAAVCSAQWGTYTKSSLNGEKKKNRFYFLNKGSRRHLLYWKVYTDKYVLLLHKHQLQKSYSHVCMNIYISVNVKTRATKFVGEIT